MHFQFHNKHAISDKVISVKRLRTASELEQHVLLCIIKKKLFATNNFNKNTLNMTAHYKQSGIDRLCEVTCTCS